jgi:ATP-dependent Clp protease ATP-binding subunit ClpB
VIERKIDQEFRAHFRPEFLNRVDETVIFNYLAQKDVEKIVSIQLDMVGQRLKENNSIDLEISKKAVAFIAAEGFDPVYGARPLKRLIQKKLVDQLALRLLERAVKAGDVLKVDVKAGELVIAL